MKETKSILKDKEHIEINLLLEGIYKYYGFDFRNYAPASLKRRIWKQVYAENLKSISSFQERVLNNKECMERFLLALSINITSLYRDPEFFLYFRNNIISYLKTYPFIRIWIAGCSTGEEVYSIAIILKEEGIYNQCRIYATDINELIIEKAKNGIFALKLMKEYTSNYHDAGGKSSFSEYYTAKYDNAILNSSLKKNIIFSKHNLVTDGSFNEFNVILCRNVMIYFNKELQDNVHRLFYQSLCMFGYLGIGMRESIKFTPHETCYENVGKQEKFYRRIK